jgi:hypothetical protein
MKEFSRKDAKIKQKTQKRNQILLRVFRSSFAAFRETIPRFDFSLE